MTRTTLAVLFAAATLASGCAGSAISDDASVPDTTAPPAAGMCSEGTADCVDTATVTDDDSGVPAIDEAALIRDAEGLLGLTEQEALDGIGETRLGRRGDETFPLIEDYRIGRRTIATEGDGTGTHRVVEVTLELTDGPLVLPAA